ncbi:MAG: methylenetetrahydrofolate--tRNA-(uracil(54)-C(5))-methyltransferase (FADH(2)-oxidizing) TrmFO [Planctomycetota bacterium]|nr:methylenetetrahydrofolate--tRNA-(uracil(54)-C(5))-methyltransferase (FADH(2)-oxidizing) TrmFO [Planctomycetota bacterium]
MKPVPVIGAGLAGSEAAWQLAEAGILVHLYEMRPLVKTPAHQGEDCAELVCSNSLGSHLPDRAGGVLMAELRALQCHLLPIAEAHAVPAGGALAVDRIPFAKAVTKSLEAHPLITLIREEVLTIPDGLCIVASGPLTSEALSRSIEKLSGKDHLSFFDAIAPVVLGDSLNRDSIFKASRWNKNADEGDYLNIPLNKEAYQTFINNLLQAECHPLKDFEASDPRAKIFFERCLPIEILAARGEDSLRFGPMRPVGLEDPRTGKRPYAVIQLRAENLSGSLYNLVGFQTHLKYGEQERILRSLPGLENVEFERLGSMHRNTFLDSPRLLTSCLEWRERHGLFFAGQITGMEGYLGNIGSGLLAAQSLIQRFKREEPVPLPITTVLGGLARHVATAPSPSFQPMKASFGALPPHISPVSKKERGQAYAKRSADDLARHLHNGCPQ